VNGATVLQTRRRDAFKLNASNAPVENNRNAAEHLVPAGPRKQIMAAAMDGT
jgi:hypothetical protein